MRGSKGPKIEVSEYNQDYSGCPESRLAIMYVGARMPLALSERRRASVAELRSQLNWRADKMGLLD